MEKLTPTELFELPRVCLVDIRSPAERCEGIGFIPGSIAFRGDDLEGELDELLDASSDLPTVLYCTSGRRTGALASAEFTSDASPYQLEGGLLGWLEEGYPTSGVSGDDKSSVELLDAPEMFVTALRSCFVGQAVETILDQEIEVDPLALFLHCANQVRVEDHACATTYLRDVVDRAAWMSRLMGTSLSSIARNVDWAYANIAHHADTFDQHPPTPYRR